MQQARDLKELMEKRLRDLGTDRGPLSARQAAGRSDGLVSYETLRLLLRGQHSGVISRDTAQGIAQALEVPLEQVLRLAGQRVPLGPFTLPERADTLVPAERAVVLSVVDAILDAAQRDRSLLRAVAGSTPDPGGTSVGSATADTSAKKVRRAPTRKAPSKTARAERGTPPAKPD
ncbi:MAG: hypothetical protein ACRC0L_04740 [Angustibacter sp.]